MEALDSDLSRRVEALRHLSSQDVVPGIQELVQLCATGAEIRLPRWETPGLGILFQSVGPLCLHFEAPEENLVHEAAIVLASACAAFHTDMWKGRRILELGAGIGFVGIVLAALGAHVVLTDLSQVEPVAFASIALNAKAIKAPGSACFCVLDWAQPRASRAACALMRTATLAIASDPADNEESMRNFIVMLQALFGTNGASLCPKIECVIVAHKHRPNFCIGGYVSPSLEAPPAVVQAQEHSLCLFQRALVDAGFTVSEVEWLKPPAHLDHPFVECWQISPNFTR